MYSSKRLAYPAKIDMVAKPDRVRSGFMIVALTTLFFLVVQPALLFITGQDALHAASRSAHATKSARQKLSAKHKLSTRQKLTAGHKHSARQQLSASRKHSSASEQNFISSDSPDELFSTTEQMVEKFMLQIEMENERSGRMKSAGGNGKSIIASLPSIKPVEGDISSEFGMREHPILKRMLFHAGTDFTAPMGSKVSVTADGTVLYSGFEKGYGKQVIIDHGNGYQTVYAHLSKAVIRKGQHVRRGDIIAFSGNSGRSTGPHLHYEVRKDNVVVNPTAFLPDDLSPDKFTTLHDTMQFQDDNNS
jgi:murein DD-endopeptidase MepM/ murein hydrolase activator NlpD